jgi:hypothetical protein
MSIDAVSPVVAVKYTINSGGGIGASKFVFSATPNSTINLFLWATDVSGTTICVDRMTHATLIVVHWQMTVDRCHALATKMA